MSELGRSRVHFVRCLKPNKTLLPDSPDAGLLLDQLLFSGMLEAVELMRGGFPGRIPFVEIHRRFAGKLPAGVMKMSPGDFVRAVISAVELKQADYQVGTSRLFFRTGGADFLTELQHADPDELVLLLKDKMMEWWAYNALSPPLSSACGGGVARARRKAVGILNATRSSSDMFKNVAGSACAHAAARGGPLGTQVGELRAATLLVQCGARRQLARRTALEMRTAHGDVQCVRRGRATVDLAQQRVLPDCKAEGGGKELLRRASESSMTRACGSRKALAALRTRGWRLSTSLCSRRRLARRRPRRLDAIDDARRSTSAGRSSKSQGGTGEALACRDQPRRPARRAFRRARRGYDRDLVDAAAAKYAQVRSLRQKAVAGLDEAMAPPTADRSGGARRALLSATTAGIGADGRARTGPIRAGAPAAA